VVAYRHGSVPELVQDGVNGFVVDDLPGAVQAVERVIELDRSAVRARWEARFTARRMACEYVELYEQLLGAASSRRSVLLLPAVVPTRPPVERAPLGIGLPDMTAAGGMADNQDLEQPTAPV
jgi:hypothetical protein